MSAGEFDGRLVVVTGAGSGIGAAIARAFASAGAVVAAVDIDGDSLSGVVDSSAGRVVPFAADVSDEDAVSRLRDDIAALGPVHSLVNQAGIIRRAVLTEMEFDQWETIQRVNVSSMFLMTRAFIPGILAAGGGSIVNCSSGAAFESGRDLAAYSASKGAVIALTRSLAVDYGPTIRVNAVCPGLVDTPGAYVGADDQVRASRQAAAERTPLQRMGTPEEVAEVVVFLASDRASFCSGSAVMVDGGKLAGA